MEEKKKQQTYFNEFTRKIIDEADYKGAYEALRRNMKARVNHNYDNHLFLQFSLLKQILKEENLDFSFLEDGSILITSEEYEQGSMYEPFAKFKYAVLAGDFKEANKQITDYELKEKRKRDNSRISTKLFVRLASAAEKSLNEQQKKAAILSRENDKELASKKYRENYSNFLSSLEDKDYEKALEYVIEASKYANEYSCTKINAIKELLQDLTKLQNKETIQMIGEVSYDDLENDYKRILYRAIFKKDYNTAYKNIGKCIDFDKKNNAFKIYHTLLSEIIKEMKKAKSTVVQKKKIEEAITEEELLRLLENREYVRARKVLENKLVNETKENDSRMNRYVLELLKELERLQSGKAKLEERVPYQEDEDSTIFDNFFRSITSKDYIKAHEYVIDCRLEEGNHDPKSFEFLAYSYLLEDISLYQKIKVYTHEKDLTMENVDELRNLYEQKIKLEGLNTKYNLYVLEVISTLQAMVESTGVMPSFQIMDSKETDVIKKFEEFMDQGDYYSSYRLMKLPEWKDKTRDVAYKDQIILIKKTLTMIIQKIVTNDVSQKIDLSMLEMPKVLEQLETLATFIESEDYIKAENYDLENKIDGNPDFLQSLSEFLPFLSTQQLRESQRIFYAYSESCSNKNVEEAKEALEEYQNFIKGTSLERNIDYHFKKIEIIEKELASPGFEIRENLIGEARKLIKEKKSEDAIEVLTKYIELDQDISPDGYIIRGNTYESLKQFDLAKKDYQKCLKINEEPNAFFRLAKIEFYQGNCEKALEYMLEFEKRRPNDNQKAMFFFQDIYRRLKQPEMFQKYVEKSKRLKSIQKRKVYPKSPIK